MNPKELIASGGIKRGEIMILSAGTGIDKSKLVEFTDRQFQERKKNKESRLDILASKKRIIKAVKHNFKTGKKIQTARSAYRLILEKVRITKMTGFVVTHEFQ